MRKPKNNACDNPYNAIIWKVWLKNQTLKTETATLLPRHTKNNQQQWSEQKHNGKKIKRQNQPKYQLEQSPKAALDTRSKQP